jgi:hypothetical protein
MLAQGMKGAAWLFGYGTVVGTWILVEQICFERSANSAPARVIEHRSHTALNKGLPYEQLIDVYEFSTYDGKPIRLDELRTGGDG